MKSWMDSVSILSVCEIKIIRTMLFNGSIRYSLNMRNNKTERMANTGTWRIFCTSGVILGMIILPSGIRGETASMVKQKHISVRFALVGLMPFI